MQSSTRSKRKSTRHAISGLLAQPTPGSSSTTRLSKSFDNRRDSVLPDHLKPSQRKLRQRRSLGSTEFNKNADLHFLETEEDTETPRARIEAFLTNADTNPEAESSSMKKPSRPNARSFNRTPNKFSKKSPGAVVLEKSNLSLPSPGSLFTPRTNIGKFLHGSGSEHSPRTRSVVSQQNKSDTKILSTNKLKNWGQTISASPLYQSGSGDLADESGASPGGNFKTLQKRKSFRIPEPPGLDAVSRKFSQRTPVKKPVKDSRLSKSDSKIKPGSLKWAQRVSTSPLNHLDLGREVVDDNSASPKRFFKHSRLRKSFHFPEATTFNSGREKVPESDANASKWNEKDYDQEDEHMPDITIKNQSNKSRQDALVQSSVPVTNSNLSQEMKDKMKVYDLSDGSSDLDLSPPQSTESKHEKSITARSGSKSMNKTLTNQVGLTPKSSGRKRLRSSSSPHFRTPSSRPVTSHVNSSSYDSVLSSKRRRLSYGESETNQPPRSEMRENQSSPFESTSKIPFAPPSSTPVKRHVPSVNNSNDRDTDTNFSRQKQVDGEVVSVLANATLQGLSPIRSVEEDKQGSHSKAAIDVPEDTSLGLVLPETELSQAVESGEGEPSQKSIASTKDKEPENAELSENESSSHSPILATPYIDMNKKPPSQSARKLNLLTPFRENSDELKRDTKKGVGHKRPINFRKSSEDVSFVSRKMVKFYAELFSSSRLDKEVIDELVKASEELWKDNLKTAEGYAQHAGRKTITEADVVLLMKVQRMIGSTEELHDLIREYLPMELRCTLIPSASAHFP